MISKDDDRFYLELDPANGLALHKELGDLAKSLGLQIKPMPEALASLYRELSLRIFDLHRAELIQRLCGVSTEVDGE